MKRLIKVFEAARMGAAAIAVVSLIAEYGFVLPPAALTAIHALDFAIVAVFVADTFLRFAVAENRARYARHHALQLSLVALLGLGIIFAYLVSPRGWVGEALRALELPSVGKLVVIVLQLYLVGWIFIGLGRLQSWAASCNIRPPVLLMASFLVVILLGTTLLALPRARAADGAPISLVDALFTATSATCVTGLTVRDTGTDFSRTGQFVIMLLIQLGGLGLVTFAAFFMLLQERSNTLRHMVLMRDILGYRIFGELGRYLKYMLIITLLAEALGAALLFNAWTEPNMSAADRLRWSVFHSISAFCNAGFSLKKEGLVGYVGHIPFNLILMGLIIIGGIGFPVLIDLLRFRIGSLPFFRRRRLTPLADPPSRLTVQTRLAILTSVTLILAGAVGFWSLEQTGALAQRSWNERLCASVFQSVSARTAGFNTVDIAALGVPTMLMLLVLMAVGASPASTGGGIRTVTVAILAATAWSMMRNRQNVEVYRRTIPRIYVNAAVAIVVVYALEVVFFTMVLTILEPQIQFKQLLFEVVSALSTVGLSTGITAGLGTPSKLLLCVAMLAGRLGPLAILMSLAGQAPSANYEYPKEEVIVA